jgi:hypothetical protein
MGDRPRDEARPESAAEPVRDPEIEPPGTASSESAQAAGPEASSDAGPDALPEAGPDARPEAGPDATPPGGRTRIGTVWLVVGALALAGILSFLVLRVLPSGRAIDLAVGECFDPPETTAETVSGVQRRPCTENHRAEVFLVADHPAAADAALPTNEELQAYLEQICGPGLLAYAGGVDAVPETIDIGLFYPSDRGWRDGDRRMTCYARTIDDSQLTRSLRSGG